MRLKTAACPRVLWGFLAIVAVAWPVAVSAQVAPLNTWIGGNFTPQWLRPTVGADGIFINCAPGTSGCTPMNLSMCSRAAAPITFTLGSSTGGGTATYTGSNQVLYAFLSNSSNCVFSTQTGGINNNANYLIGTGAPISNSVFFGGTMRVNFPADLTASDAFPDVRNGLFTTQDVLQALGACPPDGGIDLATYYICIGVDAGQTGGINNGSTSTSTSSGNSSDPYAYIQFQVDTIAPDPPTGISVKSLNKRCDVKVSIDNSTLDAYTLRVKMTTNPNNLALSDVAQNPNGNCDLWTDDVVVHDTTVYGRNDGSYTVTMTGNNGQVYGFCAQSLDYLGNVSAPTETALGEPRVECDLFECYPSELQTGFCSTGLSSSSWGVWTGLAMWRMRRARRRRQVSRSQTGSQQ